MSIAALSNGIPEQEPAQPFFLHGRSGERFCIFHRPISGIEAHRGWVYVHAFGEEMNKTRRMAALQSRRLADAGSAVLQIDLYGCGDSAGEFSDARWELWKDDVRSALHWLRNRVSGTLNLWGVRLGGLLAAEVARDRSLDIEELLLWQPIVAGDAFLTQYLRLHLAAEMLSAGAASTGMRELRAALARGVSLEIAGYELHPELAAAIDRARIAAPLPAVKRVHWFEVSGHPEPRVSPASDRVVASWRASGLDPSVRVVPGEPFWSTLEITDCEALLEATDASIGAQSSCLS